VDGDCGFDAVCQRAVCNPTTHQCAVANADTDPRCVSDACATRSCSAGVCNELPQITDCGLCEQPVSPCNPAVGPQCLPKVCDTPPYPCVAPLPGTCDPTTGFCQYAEEGSCCTGGGDFMAWCICTKRCCSAFEAFDEYTSYVNTDCGNHGGL
jgi:hypothetical protein